MKLSLKVLDQLPVERFILQMAVMLFGDFLGDAAHLGGHDLQLGLGQTGQNVSRE